MDLKRTMQELQELDQYDRLGKAYLARFGRRMTSDECYLLLANPTDDPLDYLASEEAQHKSQMLGKAFRERYYQSGLPAETFMVTGRNIQTEKVLRYVEVAQHRHDFIEITYVLQGRCTHILEDHVAVQTAGDLTIVPPGLLHQTKPDPDCVCINTKIRKEFFQRNYSTLLQENSRLSAYFTQILSDYPRLCAVTLHSGEDPFIRDTMLTIWAQQAEGLLYSDDIIQSLWRVMLAYLLQNYQETMELLVRDAAQNAQITEILNYIYENYQNITLTETARHFLLSVPYLSTRIHQLTGSTFTELLRNFRLQRAAELLRQSELKLGAICEAVGYQDVAQFIRSFKVLYHCTPGQYRKAVQEDSYRGTVV